MVMSNEDIKKALIDSWDIIVEGLANDKNVLSIDDKGKYKIEHRGKIKGLIMGFQRDLEEKASIVHFIKYAEYVLPRSDLNETLKVLLKKIQKIREDCKDDYKKMQLRIKYMIGYLGWSLDGFCNILNVAKGNAENELKIMLETEFNP